MSPFRLAIQAQPLTQSAQPDEWGAVELVKKFQQQANVLNAHVLDTETTIVFRSTHLDPSD
jgi:hypothetical protein